MPRHIETIEAYAVCNTPGAIQSPWYEFLSNGPGILDCTNQSADVLVPRGQACAFEDIQGINSLLWVQSNQNEAAGSEIILYGYDQYNSWVRTLQDGVLTDGEAVPITTAGAYTTTVWQAAGFTKAIKPITIGTVRIWEHDQTSGLKRPLAIYEPDEEQPWYRRYFLPAAGCSSGSTCCSESSTSASPACVTAMVKMRYVKARSDRDFLLIGNVPAIKDMVQAIRFAENNMLPQAAPYEAKAVSTLQDELNAHAGDGPIVRVRFEDSAIFGAGSISTLIGGGY
jgi:hypothetical protein